MKFDLEVYSDNSDSSRLLYVSSPPRRSARGREDDYLILMLKLSGGQSDQIEQNQKWTQKAAEVFFKTPGSLTSAIRVAIDWLNLSIIEKNLKLGDEEERISGELGLAVIHHDTLFVAQAGAAQAVLWREEGRTVFFDEDLSNRALGLSQVPKSRFFQSDISGGDLLCFGEPTLHAWLESQNLTFAELNSKALFDLGLAQHASLDLVRFSAGSGQVRFATQARVISEPQSLPAESPLAAPEAEVSAAMDVSSVAPAASTPPSQPNFGQETTQVAMPLKANADTPNTTETRAGLSSEELEARIAQRAAEEAARERRKKEAYLGLARSAGKVNKFGDKLKGLFKKAEPLQEGVILAKEPLSFGLKLVLALLIPLVIVAIGSSVYITRGREDQYQYLMAQARAAASNAALMSEASLRRTGWNEVFSWLDQAAEYRDSNEARALRVQAQAALDNLDGALRLNYRPVFSAAQMPGLDIARLVTVGSDIFLLDRGTGAVLHLTQTDAGYSFDLDFDCKPGSYEGGTVGKLLDIAAVPVTNPSKAPLMAMDAGGTTLYCGVGKSAQAYSLIPPAEGFGKIAGIAYDSGRLFILDPVRNALWIYRGFSSGFTNPPDTYFEPEQADLSQARQAVVAGDELFTLFEDGSSMHCLASNVTGKVECDNPYPYQETRPGYEAKQTDFLALAFTQLAYSPPPDPSLYYLSPTSAQLYQFSLRLNLNRVLRATAGEGLPGSPVTAFTLTTNRKVLLAFGNALFIADLP